MESRTRTEQSIAQGSIQKVIRETPSPSIRSVYLTGCIPIKMVPCECGKPFGDLTDWKAHSTMTGHCCTYKCRKLSSAASISGFAFDTETSSTFRTNHTPYPLLSNAYFPWPSTRQDPVSFTTHPIEDCSLLPNGIWKVPAFSTRQPNLAYQSPDGTVWPAPVPLTKSQTAAYYQSLNSRPAPILTSIPHPMMASSTQFSNVPAPMARHTPPAADSDGSMI